MMPAAKLRVRGSATFATAVLLVLSASEVRSQPVQLGPGRLLATFEEASSLGVDPAGRIYVTDAGEHVLRILDAKGTEVFTLGGPGSGEGQFDEPSGVDPTNGLAIVVADAGNHRLQRFTRTFQLIESIPLYGQGPDPVGAAVAGAPKTAGSRRMIGRPVAVAVSDANELFVVDESQAAVARFDSGRRFKGFMGAADDFGHLKVPVDIALIGELVFVADRAQRSVLVYDQFGGFVTEMGGGRLADLNGLFAHGNLLLVVYGTQVAIFDVQGGMIAEFTLPATEHARDIGYLDQSLLVLTARSLFSFRIPERISRPSNSEKN